MYAQYNNLCQFGLLSQAYQPISPSILIHFWWNCISGALNGSIPLLVLYRITPDISIMLLYTFYQPVFYATHDQHFPSESEERAVFW